MSKYKMITDKILCTPVTFGEGHKILNSRYNKFKDAIKSNLKGHFDKEINLKIELFIENKRIRKGKNDLDNFLKPIIDAIDEKKIDERKIIDSETQICSIFIKRIKVDSSNQEGVKIELIPEE